jgi:hypothetical protein
MHLDEARIDQESAGRVHGRIESFGVADGQRHAGPSCRVDHGVRLGQRTGHRLFDQHGNSGAEERQRDFVVELGRHGQGDGIDAAVKLAGIRQRRRATRRGNLFHAGRILVDDSDEIDPLKGRQNPGVVLAEMADSHDGDA